MKESERDFFEAVGVTKNKFDKLPNLMVRERRDKMRLMIHSTMEAPVVIGDWVTITLSPQEFVNMAGLCQTILGERTKKEKK